MLRRTTAGPTVLRTASGGMSRRGFLGAMATVGASTALAGCSTAGSAGGGGGGGLSYFSWETQQVMQPLLDLWLQQNPDVPIEFSQSPPVAEYIGALQTRVLSGTAADVFMMAAENKTNLIDGAAVVDLSSKPYLAEIDPLNAATYGRDGAVYGLSPSSWGAGMNYNRELLSRVGASTVPETWEEFLALCAELRAAGITPYIEGVVGPSRITAAFLGAQNVAMGGSMDKQIFDGGSTFAAQWSEPLRQWLRLWDEGYADRGTVGITNIQARDEFAQGRAAMTPSAPYDVPVLRRIAPDLDFALTRIPALPGGTPYLAGAASPAYAINARSDDQELADRFLSFLVSPAAMDTFYRATNTIPTVRGFTPEVDPALQAVADGVRAGDIYLPQVAWTRAEDKLNETAIAQAQLLVQGRTTPEGMATELDRVLAANS